MPFPFTVDLQNEGLVTRFRTADEMANFFSKELSLWRWLSPQLSQISNNQNQISEIYTMINTMITDHGNFISLMNAGHVDQAFSTLSYYLQRTPRLPLSHSPHAELVQQVQREISGRAAVGALAALSGTRFDGDDTHQVRGAFVAHELLQGTGKAARQSIQSALDGLLKRLGTQQSRAEDKADALDERTAQVERRRQRQFAKLLAAGKSAREQFAASTNHELQRIGSTSQEHIDSIGNAAEAAIASIQATEKTYTEHMALQGPVTYWRDKAKEHKKKAAIARWIGLAYAATVAIYAYADGAWRILALVQETVEQTKQWQLAYVVLTVAAILLTIAFWIGRLISRTYVSEAHLAIDADERATMVQTYLALSNEGKIENSERLLVLGALFRPSSDGLVKDDAAPDLSLAGLGSRLGVGQPQATR